MKSLGSGLTLKVTLTSSDRRDDADTFIIMAFMRAIFWLFFGAAIGRK